jgi:hypothetical protein
MDQDRDGHRPKTHTQNEGVKKTHRPDLRIIAFRLASIAAIGGPSQSWVDTIWWSNPHARHAFRTASI